MAALQWFAACQPVFLKGGSGGVSVEQFIEVALESYATPCPACACACACENVRPSVLTARCAAFRRDDPEQKTAAEGAKLAWVPAINLPAGNVQNAVPPSPDARMVTLVFSLALLGCWFWGLVIASNASKDFMRYVASDSFDVIVAKVDGFDGPVDALIPPGKRCGAELCVDVLSPPDPHQRWWGLVPSDQVGHVQAGTGTLLRARNLVMYLTVFTGTSAVLKPLGAVYANQARCLTDLSSAGINSMIGMAMMCGLYGMYWHAELELVFINYVPGWAYFWFAAWL